MNGRRGIMFSVTATAAIAAVGAALAIASAAVGAADQPATGPAASAPASVPATALVETLAASTQPITGPATGPSMSTASTQPDTRPSLAGGGPGRFDNNGRGGNPRFGDRGGASVSSAGSGSTLQLKPMSNDFAVLNTRSIFVHGRLRSMEEGPVPTQPAPDPPVVVKQKSLVFNGVTRADGLVSQVTAILEDTMESKILSVQLGDQIAGGVVTNITLDKLEFTPTATGKPVAVAIGQNLQGAEAPRPTPATSSASASGSPSGGATTGPSTPPASVGAPLTKLPGESMADFLRRRRSSGQ